MLVTGLPGRLDACTDHVEGKHKSAVAAVGANCSVAWDTALARAKGFWKTFRQQPNKVYYDLLFLERSKDIVSTLN